MGLTGFKWMTSTELRVEIAEYAVHLDIELGLWKGDLIRWIWVEFLWVALLYLFLNLFPSIAKCGRPNAGSLRGRLVYCLYGIDRIQWKLLTAPLCF